MTGKDRILNAMKGAPVDLMPVGVDYMGLYLEERTEGAYVAAYRERLQAHGRVRIDPDEDVEIRADALWAAYGCFQERHDCLDVRGCPSREALSQRELLLEDGRVFEIDHSTDTRRQMLRGGQESKTDEMRERLERMGQSGTSRDQLAQLLRANRQRVLAARGNFEFVERIACRHGDDFFLYGSVGAPFVTLSDLIGFEGMMTAMYDAPDLLNDAMESLLDFKLALMQDYRDAGGHGIRIEECLASADIISPRMYDRFARPYEERLIEGIRALGLKAILYFCGDVMPRMPALRGMPLDALMVEESKKGFEIDIGQVREAVGPELCLLGNIDVYEILEKGTESELEAEVARQVRLAGAHGTFIVGVGSPVTLVTPPERVDQLIRSARRQRPPLAK